MSKRTRMRQLEGRMIESAIIYHADDNDPSEGPTLELRLSGDKYFSFKAECKVRRIASCLVADNTNDELKNQKARSFNSDMLTGVDDEELWG
jgi:hypothetical protein